MSDVIKIRGEVLTVPIGAVWTVNIVTHPILELPSWHVPHLIQTIEQWDETWKRIFPEETFARQQGVASMIVRLDYTVVDYTGNEEGEIKVYEVESAPGGIGISSFFNPDFRERLHSLEWTKKVMVLISPDRVTTNGVVGDDYLWAPTVTDASSIPPDALVFLRGFRGNEHEELYPRSVTPVPRNQKDKHYGIGWLWGLAKRGELEELHNRLINQLKWRGVVYKAPHGRGAREVAIVLPKNTRTKMIEWLGSSSGIGIHGLREAFQRIRTEEIIYQEFHPPIKVKFNDDKRMFGIWRIFAVKVPNGGWKVIGGFFNIRRSLLIHGADDAVFFLVVPPR